MKRQFNLQIKEELTKNYNIAAADNAYILTNQSLELQYFRWGLIPHWAQDESVGENLINAMAEGIESKLSFRLPLRQRRCLVFADSYYEWQRIGRKQQPYRISMYDNSIMAFAGVWDIWLNDKKEMFKTFSIITTASNTELEDIGQNRMPVILNNGVDQTRWLTEVSLNTALKLLKPLENGLLSYYPISTAIDTLKNNHIDLHKAIELSEDDDLK